MWQTVRRLIAAYVATAGPGHRRIVIDGTGAVEDPSTIGFFSASGGSEGLIQAAVVDVTTALNIDGPSATANANGPAVAALSQNGITGATALDLSADAVTVSRGGLAVTGALSSTAAVSAASITSSGQITLSAAGAYIKRGSLTTATLKNSWVQYGSPYNVASYAECPDGTGMICGVIKNGTTTTGTVLFTLPAALAPTNNHVFTCSGDNGGVCQVVVKPTGDVIIQNPFTGQTWLSFGSIRYPLPTF